MRVLKSIFSSLIILAIFSVIAFFLGRELVVFLSLYRLKNSIRLMRNITTKGEYNTQCRNLGSINVGNEDIFTAQLRFISDTEYVVEIVCNQFIQNPFEAEKNKLLPLVKKDPGNSGIIWGVDQAGVNIGALGRRGAVIVQDETIATIMSDEELNLADGPLASCEGYGFSCCQEDLMQGIGDQLEGVLDCPKTCYSSCLNRPVVLSFNSQPFFEKNTRSVRVKAGEKVVFAYVVSDTSRDEFADMTLAEEGNGLEDILTLIRAQFVEKDELKEQDDEELVIILDFGDGKNETLFDLQGHTEHVYTCNRDLCKFKAELVVKRGKVESADNLLSRIDVLVTR